MRIFSAILLTCIFTFSQYARHLSYLECKIFNSFKSSSKKCDCEKQAGFEKSGDEQSSAPKAHLHIHLDEFFSGADEDLISTHYPSETKTGLPVSDNESEGCYPTPWRPPDS